MQDILTSKRFLDELIKQGINFFSGVPDSVISKMIALVEETEKPYVNAVCEDIAVAVCAGAYLAGKNPCVLMQNSGLGNATDTIITINQLYKIPALFVITWRGFDGKDEIQHLDWGRINLPLLNVLGMPYFLVAKDNYKKNITAAMDIIKQQNESAVLIIRRGYLDEKR